MQKSAECSDKGHSPQYPNNLTAGCKWVQQQIPVLWYEEVSFVPARA